MFEKQILPQQRPVDALIAGLCESQAELLERYHALEALAQSRGDDAASYQFLAKRAIDALHREQLEHRKLRERYDRIVVENRDLRSQVISRKHAGEAAA